MLKKIHSVAIYVVCSLLTTMATDALAAETGLASYYSDKFQGRKTASGEHYDRNKLTAAHRTLPIGSQIEVTNLKNQNSVIVTINDRGPYAGNRTLDLSYAAAKELGLVAAGVTPITFDVVKAEKDSNFEKVIPAEYTQGSLGLAKSVEEVIEAEEELANSDKSSDTSTTVKAEKSSRSRHKHNAKKVADNSQKLAHASKNQAHSEKESKSKKSATSDKPIQKTESKAKQIAKSDKHDGKKATKSKKSRA